MYHNWSSIETLSRASADPERVFWDINQSDQVHGRKDPDHSDSIVGKLYGVTKSLIMSMSKTHVWEKVLASDMSEENKT